MIKSVLPNVWSLFNLINLLFKYNEFGYVGQPWSNVKLSVVVPIQLIQYTSYCVVARSLLILIKS